MKTIKLLVRGEHVEEYTPKQAADNLEIGTETLKKYALLLEHNGHTVHRNARNHRVYNDTDIFLIKAMIKLNREKSMPLEDAASKVTSSDFDIRLVLGDDLHNDDTVPDNVTHNTVRTVTTLQDNAWLEFYNGFITELRGLKEENNALQRLIVESETKHSLAIEEVSNKLGDQAKVIEEQSKAIAEQSATIAELHKRLDEAASKKPSLWARLFGR